MKVSPICYHLNFYNLDGLYKLTINICISVKNVVPIP